MFFKLAVNSRHSLLLAACIVAFAVAGAVSPNTPILRLAGLAPIAYAMAVVGDAATAFVLLSTWRYASGKRSTFVLGLSFGACAIILLLAMATLPLMPENAPMLDVSEQTGIWLYVFWHVVASAGALSYVVFRRRDDAGHPSKRFTVAATSIATAVVALAVATAFVWVDRLPALASHASVARLMSTGVGPATVLLLGLATWLAVGIAGPTTIERSLAFSLLAITFEFTLFLAGGHRYSGSYYVGRVLLLFGASFVLWSAMRALIDARIELHGAELASKQLAHEASLRADRIRAIWAIASKGGPSALAFDAILQTATIAIRPGKAMFGCLSHLDDQQVIVDATSWSASEPHTQRFMDSIFPGATFALKNTMSALLLTETRTTAWDDLTVMNGDGKAWSEAGWQSYIGTTVTIGRKTYFLSFGSPEPMTDRPFAEDDKAYIDVVASFFATRFSEALQFERIQFQIEHDALTGLHNRAQFRNAIRNELNRKNRFTLAFINLDAFRQINERHGHMLGDEVLVEIAMTLAAVNANDLVARMNGDEFGVLLSGVETPASTASALEKYAEQFHTPFHTGDREGTRMLKVGASIGSASFPEDGTTPEELMRRADVALSVAKARNGSTTVSFDHSMETILEESRVRLVELADAIAGDQLALVYQPTFDLATRTVTGAEALVRWDHPERGRLLPAEFIPTAERNGLINPLTRWVLQRLIRDFTGGVVLPSGFRVYFNVAAQTLDDFTFIADLNEALRAAPGLAAHLGVEMTETTAMQNIDGAMHTISLLRKWGLSVAIDDFGTGHSSLSYLKQLIVDVIKIDRSFVIGLPHDEHDGAITELLLQLTNRFGLTTLAEGIETEEQLRWLLDHGCRLGQGYLLARPGSLETLQQRLREHGPAIRTAASRVLRRS